jgi:hypothetical protein
VGEISAPGLYSLKLYFFQNGPYYIRYQYGEGRIANILVAHLIDTKQHDTIEQLSQQRGTALSTLYYTSYSTTYLIINEITHVIN